MAKLNTSKKTKTTTAPEATPEATTAPEVVPAPVAKPEMVQVPVGPFTTGPLNEGFAMRREKWAPKCTIVRRMKGGRGNQLPSIYMTGSRAGEVIWKPIGWTDVLARDWFALVPAGDPIVQDQVS